MWVSTAELFTQERNTGHSIVILYSIVCAFASALYSAIQYLAQTPINTIAYKPPVNHQPTKYLVNGPCRIVCLCGKMGFVDKYADGENHS